MERNVVVGVLDEIFKVEIVERGEIEPPGLWLAVVEFCTIHQSAGHICLEAITANGQDTTKIYTAVDVQRLAFNE